MFRLKEMTSFLLEMILAIIVFAWNKKKRKYYWIIIPCAIVASYFIVDFATVYINKIEIGLLGLILKYMFAFCVVVGLTWASFDRPFKKSFLTVSEAYVLQNLAFYLFRIISLCVKIDFKYFDIVRWSVILFVYGVAFVFSLFLRKLKIHSEKSSTYYILSTISIFGVLILSSFNTYTKNFGIMNCVYAIIVDLFMLTMYFGLFRISMQRRIIEMYGCLLRLEHNQMQLSKNAVDIINFKCHDLRHQISVLRNGRLNPEYDEQIKKIENAISDYEAMCITGNEVLDIVISEKYLLCLKEKIEFSYNLEGKQIYFMEDMDICTLFGNALENAINSVRYEDVDKKFINLLMIKKQNLLCIHMENYCKEPPEFKDGLPITRNDEQFHGYGTRSMKETVEKYGGNLVMEYADNVFITDITIPVPPSKM